VNDQLVVLGKFHVPVPPTQYRPLGINEKETADSTLDTELVAVRAVVTPVVALSSSTIKAPVVDAVPDELTRLVVDAGAVQVAAPDAMAYRLTMYWFA